MYLDLKSVRAGNHRRKGHRLDEGNNSRRVRGVNANRQVGLLLKKRHCRYIKCISRHCFKSPDTSFAKGNVHVSPCHDVLGGHEKLLQSVCQTAFEQYGLVALAESLKKLEVLHISCAHLNNVNISKKVKVGNAHYLGNYGQTRFLPCFEEKLDPLALQALERIGRSSGLERAAAEHCCARFLAGDSGCDNLFFAFNGAGTRDNLQGTVAHNSVTNLDNGIVGVEFSVSLFVRLLNAADFLNAVLREKVVHINYGGVTDKSYNALACALDKVCAYSFIFKNFYKSVYRLLLRVLFKNDDHFYLLLLEIYI